MKNIGGSSRFIGFLDECGDHSLLKIDTDFPLFVLALVVMERESYSKHVIPTLGEFKLRYWNHEGINLHSREIRKALGPFAFLQIPTIRPAFIEELGRIMKALPYTLFVTGIRKQQHKERYGQDAESPYDLVLKFTLERVVHFLEGQGEKALPVVAESRGKIENADLERVFFRIMNQGTYYRPKEQFKKLDCPLVFRSKMDNIVGIQIADLCAYPCARHVLAPGKPNMAFEAIHGHLYRREGVFGMKVFP